jgi:hypothetical protein
MPMQFLQGEFPRVWNPEKRDKDSEVSLNMQLATPKHCSRQNGHLRHEVFHRNLIEFFKIILLSNDNPLLLAE